MKKIFFVFVLFVATLTGNVALMAQSVNCNLTLKTTIQGFKVYKHNPSGAIMFRAKFAIDADGSPRAYGPNNSGLDYTANAGYPGNWWGIVTNSNGTPYVQVSTDPYPGMYVSPTSLVNTAYTAKNPLRYVNSETIPFYVLPSAVTQLAGIQLGDIAYVYNTVTGLGCYAIFADGGPAGKLGEGSIYLADKLGINSNARTGGTSQGIIDYIVFPGSGSGQGVHKTIAQIDAIGAAMIATVGGTGITGCLNVGSCGTPLALASNTITATTATLTWSSVSGAGSYNVKYKKTTSTTWTTVSSMSTSKTISGLSAGTAYEFQVQAICSSAGSFSSSVTFTTAAASTLANDNCSGAIDLIPNTTCVQTAGTIAGATASGLAKASCDGFSGTPKLFDVWYKFQATASSHTITVAPSSSFDAVLSLYTSCSGGQIGCADNGGGGGASETINATGLTVGTTYYVRVYSYGATLPSTATFNICVNSPVPSSCGTPSGLTAGGITSGGATLSWTTVSGATSYTVQYKPVSSSSWVSSSASSTNKVLSGLSPATAYEFKVQAVCSSAGNYSSVSNFSTLSSGSSSNEVITVGTGTSAYSAHPFGTIYMDERTQYIITKQELTAAGWSAGSPYLSALAFNVTSAASQTMNSFTVSIAHVSASSFTSTSFMSGSNSTVVYSGTTTATQGWNTYTFNTPFAYDGISNLLITICWNNSSFTANSSVQSYSYSNYMALYYRQDVANGGVCNTGSGTRSYYRPNTRLTFSSLPGMQMENEGDIRSVETENADDMGLVAVHDLQLFPNPSDGTVLSGMLTLGSSNNAEEIQTVDMQVYDMMGRSVFSDVIPVQDRQFSVSFHERQLQQGMYVAVVLAGDKRFTRTLVIR